jgi:serine/threonine protein kinase
LPPETRDDNQHPQVNDIIDGLSFMHSLDVVHGDLKPVSSLSSTPSLLAFTNKQDNVLVDSQFRARLTDFGLAITIYATVTATTTGRGVGTTRYMAPELFEWDEDSEDKDGGKPTKGTDTYALAITIWQVCYCLPSLAIFLDMTCPQIYSEQIPYVDITSDIAVSRRVLGGTRPSITQAMIGRGLDVIMWSRVQQWWVQERENRPSLNPGDAVTR